MLAHSVWPAVQYCPTYLIYHCFLLCPELIEFRLKKKKKMLFDNWKGKEMRKGRKGIVSFTRRKQVEGITISTFAFVLFGRFFFGIDKR